ncbi:hypothetical protein FACS1894139_17820 [Planctomycetales bacterium]|nr:hypothetical protein FACS1894108_12850 [Planctomycetales bacterium]GHT08293.1 hypothetical protein FACS1894139_17820 [Planctomycetales bacterium]
MKKAEHLNEIVQVFGPEPLSKKNDEEDDLEQFFCETMSVRTGDVYDSPLDDIFADCCRPSGNNAHLLLGHKGCGKSTELNYLQQRFEKAGHQVAMISCINDADIFNIAYWDLLILIAEKLCYLADKKECALDKDLLKNIANYWKDIERIEEKSTDAQVEGTAQAGGGFNFFGLGFLTRIKGDIKYGSSRRTEIREHVKKRPAELIGYIREIADTLTKKSDGKQPIIIVEELDKIEPEVANKLFFNTPLSQLPFPTIFTFPISLFYAPMFAGLEGFFSVKVLPMIKIKTLAGEPFAEGVKIIEEIIKKRADVNLFTPDALTLLIEKTGGCLRDLFSMIINAARRAEKRRAEKVEAEDVERVLIELKSRLSRRIEVKHYEFLATIHQSAKKRTEIADHEMLLEMLQGMIVLEYNGKRWHDVHPLILDFLREQGCINGND